MNFFELYDLPVGFAVPKEQLKRKYYQLSRKYHPDYHDATSSLSAGENLLMSSKVNEGYALLQDDYAVIAYVLQLKGYLLPDEKVVLPPEFLMEMMELNEDLQPDQIEQIDAFSRKIKEPVQGFLLTNDLSTLTIPDFHSIKDYYYKEKYLRRLRDRATGKTISD